MEKSKKKKTKGKNLRMSSKLIGLEKKGTLRRKELFGGVQI